MRISDWSSDVCSSDLLGKHTHRFAVIVAGAIRFEAHKLDKAFGVLPVHAVGGRHTELLKLVDRQVNASAPGVVANVADDVCQLTCNAEFFRISQRRLLRIAEYPGGKLANNDHRMPAEHGNAPDRERGCQEV